jgi:Helicase conserved C-terminal domain
MATTFVDQLRSLPDAALGALIQLRPDLVVPVPSDLSALAVRAQSRGSVARCLDTLDEFTLQILDAARLSRAAETALTSVDAILALSVPAAPADDVREAIGRLQARFVLTGPEDALQIVGAVDEVTSPYPAGLGRPADYLDRQAAALCADKAQLRRTVLAAPTAARAVLDRLAAGPPIGALNGTAAMAEPVRWLVEHHVLVAVSEAGRAPRPDGELVELPREVGLLLRRDTGPLGVLRPLAPTPTAPVRDPKSSDSAGAGQAMETVRNTETLLEALAAEPAPVLRTGGLGVRDLKRLARAAGIDEPATALLLEVAYAAGLLGEADATGVSRAITISRAHGPVDEIFLPTGGFDLWRALSIAQRWDLLIRSWLAMTRQPSLVGQRDDRDRPVNPLSPEVERTGAPQARREALVVLAELTLGTAPPVDEVLGLLAWQAPRRVRGREAAHRDALAGAAALGVTALNAITSYARLLLDDAIQEDTDPLGVRPGMPPTAQSNTVRALDALLPAPVDHVLVQADLSVMVPGPPEPELAAELDAVAEQESASMHRVTAASVRRALDVGYSAGDLHALFKRRSRTPVPQAMTYLIDDAARKHGGLRAGSASGYLRSDDEALIVEVLANRRLAGLGLRRLAPTVLVSPYQVARLLGALRDAGFAPVAEDAGGAAVLSRPKVRRAPSRTAMSSRLPDQAGPPALAGPRLAGVVEQIRRGDRVNRAARRAPVTVRAANGQSGPGLTAVQAHSQAMAVLQQAVREKAKVWVGYVDSHGSTLSRLVRPVSLSAGYLRAEDERTETLHTFALHRITAAVPEE